MRARTPQMTGVLPDGRSLRWYDAPPFLGGDDGLVEEVKNYLARDDWIMVTPTGPTVKSTRRNQLAVFSAANLLMGPSARWQNAPDVTFGNEPGTADGPDAGWEKAPTEALPIPVNPTHPIVLPPEPTHPIAGPTGPTQPTQTAPSGQRALAAAINEARMVIGLEPLTADGWNPEEQWRDPGGENGGQWIEMPDIKAIVNPQSTSTGEQKATTEPVTEPAPEPTMVREGYVLEKFAADMFEALGEQQAAAQEAGDDEAAQQISDARRALSDWNYDTLRLDPNFERLGTSREELDEFLDNVAWLRAPGVGEAVAAMRDALLDADEKNAPAEPEPEPEGEEEEWLQRYNELAAQIPEASQIGMVAPTVAHMDIDHRTDQRDLEAMIAAVEKIGWENYGDMPKEHHPIWHALNFKKHAYDPEAMKKMAYEELAKAKAYADDAEAQWLSGQPELIPDLVGSKREPGPVLQAQLQAMLEMGAILNAELKRRIAAREPLGELPEKIKMQEFFARGAREDLAKAQQAHELARYNAEQAAYRDYTNAMFDRREKELVNGPEDARTAAAAKRDSARRRQAREIVEAMDRRLAADGLVALAEHDVRAAEQKVVRNEAVAEQAKTGVLQPGTEQYALAQREEALGILSQIRPMGGNQEIAFNIEDEEQLSAAEKAMAQAMEIYPADWHEQLAEELAGDSYQLGVTNRGKHNWDRRELMLSPGGSHMEGGNEFTDVAAHELGHGMERAVDGLVLMERAMSFFRSPRGEEVLRDLYANGKEKAWFDEWGSPYSGKDYGRWMDSEAWEIFTTGIESLMAGSRHFDRSADMGGRDEEFRAFILALLARL